MKNNYDVVFDFIKDKMLKKNEIVVFANKMLYNDSITGDYLIYKIVTIDDSGKVHVYAKDLINDECGYFQIAEI